MWFISFPFFSCQIGAVNDEDIARIGGNASNFFHLKLNKFLSFYLMLFSEAQLTCTLRCYKCIILEFAAIMPYHICNTITEEVTLN